MRTIIKKGIRLSVVLLFLYITPAVLAEDPAPPGGNSGPGSTPVGNGTPVGGAPIDGGVGILLAMGAVYGGYKLYKSRKESSEEEQQEVQ